MPDSEKHSSFPFQPMNAIQTNAAWCVREILNLSTSH